MHSAGLRDPSPPSAIDGKKDRPLNDEGPPGLKPPTFWNGLVGFDSAQGVEATSSGQSKSKGNRGCEFFVLTVRFQANKTTI
jgi:hypothetical protein